MGLFGRTSCNEDRNWHVKVVYNHGHTDLTEQLNEDEARDFFEKLMKEVESNKTGFIKVHKDRGHRNDKDYFINLSMAESFVLYNY